MKYKLGECIEEIVDKTTENNQYEVLSVTKDGIYSQEEFFKKQIASEDNTGYKIIRKNNLVFSTMNLWMGSLDVLSNYEIGIVSPAYKVFKFNESKMIPSFGKYFMKSHFMLEQYKNCSEQGASVVRRNLDLKQLLDTEIIIPTVEEQCKIVKVLENIDEIINKYTNLIKNKEQFIKSQFVEMFEHNNGICMKSLKMVTSFQQGTQVPIEQQTDEMLEGYKRFLRIIDYTQPPQEARYVNVKGKEVDEKSVVVVRYGASSGFVGRGYSGVLANNLFEIQPKNNSISKEFLYYSLKYGSFESVINKKASGAAMPAISFNMIEDIMIPIPDIELQNRFSDIVQLIDKQKFELEKQKQNYIDLKKGLMQQLLTGKVKLDV